MLLFADDIALFITNPESLQLQLNALYDYSCKWGLKINVKKTKICNFEKKKSRSMFNWKINYEINETVDEFCYLGIKFQHTGNMSNTVKALTSCYMYLAVQA